MKNENNFYVIRGKTDRRRKRDRIKQIQKQYIKLYKKENLLCKQERSLGFEALEQPYQKGFKRFFVLRKEIHSEKQILFYNELLTIINTKQLSLRKDFKKRKRVNRKKVYLETEQKLSELNVWEFLKLPEKFKPHFIRVEYHHLKWNSITIKYIFCEPWRYVLRVEPNMITHIKKIDSVLESEIKEIENFIEHHYLRPKISKSRSKKFKWKEHKIKNKEVQIPILKLLKINEQY